MGRIISIADALGHTKHFTYDKADNVTGVTDENGNITQYHYDLLGNLTQVIYALGHSTKYSYDALSNLSKVDQLRIIDGDLADAQAINERQVTEYKRDKNGRVISVTDPLGGIVSYSYDAMGNIIEKQDKDGSLTKCQWRTEIFAANHKRPDAALRTVVGYLQTPVQQISEQMLFLSHRIMRCFAKEKY